MATYDIMNAGIRKELLEEIMGEENKRRKEESLRRWEIYRQNQKEFIMKALTREFAPKTVTNMRTLTSVNLTKRIIDQKASIYREAPERVFTRKSGTLNDQEMAQCKNIYEHGNFDVSFKKANRLFKLQSDQIHLQIIPEENFGCLTQRVLMPHHLDVVPSKSNPEMGEIFITSVMDKARLLQSESVGLQDQFNPIRDFQDQKIADADDGQKLANMRFVWWTDEYNFITDGYGNIIPDDDGGDVNDVTNPIGMAPFVDVSFDKDFEYWQRSGSNIVDFALDFGVVVSDTANINRLQGYAQGVIYAEKAPGQIVVGPNNIMHIPLDPNKEIQPRFEFVSPNPDLEASLKFMDSILSFLLFSEGLDNDAVSGKMGTQNYSSAIERLLAMVERYEASRDDIDSFKKAERRVFDINKAWSNLFQNTVDENGDEYLDSELMLAMIPDDTKVTVNFKKPEQIMTEKDKTDNFIAQIEGGLMSKSEAIAKLREIPIEEAVKVLAEIDSEGFAQMPMQPTMPPKGQVVMVAGKPAMPLESKLPPQG